MTQPNDGNVLEERLRQQVLQELQPQLQKEHDRSVQAFDSACDYKQLAAQLQATLAEAQALGAWAAEERDQLRSTLELPIESRSSSLNDVYGRNDANGLEAANNAR